MDLIRPCCPTILIKPDEPRWIYFEKPSPHHQLSNGLCVPWQSPLLGFTFNGSNTVNAPPIMAAIEIQKLLYSVGQRPWMLNDFSVHIHYIKITIRSVGKLNRAKPDIRGTHKFYARFLCWTPRGRDMTFRIYSFSVNQITAAISNKGMICILPCPGVSCIQSRSRCSRKVPRRSTASFNRPTHGTCYTPFRTHDSPRFIRTDPKNRSGGSIFRDADPCRLLFDEWIQAGECLIIDNVLQVITVTADEFPSVAIKRHSILCSSTFGA